MIKGLAIVAAVLFGVGEGWLWTKIPLRPLIRDIGAAVVALVLAPIVTTAVALALQMRIWAASGSGGLGALSVGIAEPLIAVAVSVVLVIALLASRGSRRISGEPILWGMVVALVAAIGTAAAFTMG